MGLSLEEAIEKAERELMAERADYDRLLMQAMSLTREVLGGVPGSELVIDGEFHLLDEPEFADADAFRRVIQAIEEKRSLLHLLDRCRESQGVRVFLGADAGLENMDSIGIVSAPYFKDGKVIGALGVFGPMRMDYSRVVPIVDFTAKVLSDVLAS
ncbi:MAG: HrcA family transcriptional regulator, partial [bacterium]